jgi:rare lipoprotein A
MKWNASLAAALSLLLAACGGGRGYDYGLEPAGAPRGSVAAQSWGSPPGPLSRPQPGDAEIARESETWRAADGSIRTRAPAPQLQAPAEPEPDAPRQDIGASYAPPMPGPAVPQPAPAPDAQDPSAGIGGPRGSSQPDAGERRYDEIGYAGIRTVAGGGAADGAAVAVHRALPAGTVVEVTALDTGRTILVLVTGPPAGGDRPMEVSAGAARQLGHDGPGPIPVRIRRVAASAQDVALLRAGQPASPRADTPPVLLNALRRHLPAAAQAASPAPVRARPAAAPAPRAAVRGGFVVQVAALSNAANAQSLAKAMGGFVKQGGGLHRVQLGPFATSAEAERARAGAARAGYGDARVIAAN